MDGSNFFLRPPLSTGVLFLDGRQRPITTRSLTCTLKQAGQLAGLDPRCLSSHCLRIGGASHGAEVGLSELQLAQAGRLSFHGCHAALPSVAGLTVTCYAVRSRHSTGSLTTLSNPCLLAQFPWSLGMPSGSDAARSGGVSSLSSCLCFIGFFCSGCLLAFLQLAFLGNDLYPSPIRLPAFLYSIFTRSCGPSGFCSSYPGSHLASASEFLRSGSFCAGHPGPVLFSVPAISSSCGLGSFCPVIRVLTRFGG